MNKELANVCINSLEKQIDQIDDCHKDVLPQLKRGMKTEIKWLRKILNGENVIGRF